MSNLDNIEDQNRSEFVDFDALFAIVRRQWKVVGISVGVALVLCVGYLMTAVPEYTATARLLIDRNNSQVLDDLSALGGIMNDESTVLSQLEVLRSEAVGVAVVDKLDLTNNTIFNAQGRSLFTTLKGLVRSATNISQWFSGPAQPDPEADSRRRRAASDALMSRVTVARVGKTFVFEVNYTSPSPRFASEVANAIADAYLVDKLNSKYEATRRASDWLIDRIAELRQKALETDLAVQKFRATHGLVQIGEGGLVSDQQLSQLNTALIGAQSDVAKAQARLQRIQQIVATDDADAAVNDILDSSVANELRKKYLEASKLEAEITRMVGPNHVRATRLRDEMREYKRLMFDELNRLAQSYKSDLDVATAREKSLVESVEKATGVSTNANETQVQLRELQREAETYRNLYQTFLQRYQEAVQQQSFPVTDARVISKAVAPGSPSKPNRILVLAIFTFFGAAVGSGIGVYREYRDRFFRTGDQIRDVLNQEFLGNAHALDNTLLAASAPGGATQGSISKTSSVSDYVVSHPLSSFAETLRGARLAIDLGVPGKAARTIGVVSTLPGEGKSTIAINLAELLAGQGARTILIDADIRSPGATRSLGHRATEGLLEVLLAGKDYRDVILHNKATGLAFLPTVVRQRVSHSSELLMSAQMQRLLTELTAAYDYVIVDLPPIGPVVDARAMSSRLDGFIFVVEWGRTARRVVQNTLATEPLIRQKTLGVILNKVDPEKLKLYRAYGSGDYYYSRYSQYYVDGNA